MKRIEAVNDFVIKFANVNGSGSASANELFAKAVIRMGVPVAPRNIFPSNIQGLPTWYEVRVSEQGWSGRACSPGLAERGGGPIHEQRQLLNRLRGETAQRRHDVRHARLTRLAEAGVGPASEFVEQLPRQGGHGGGAGHHR